MAEALVIETAELRKRFDCVEALRGLNLQVPAGSIFGFLGRNGAGKTTTIKLLLGMARPTSGQARVFGLGGERSGRGRRDPPPHRVRRTRTRTLYDYMTVDEIIRFTAAFYPRWRPRSRAALSADVRAAAAPDGQGAVARHAHQALARCWRSAAAPSCSCSTSRPRGSIRPAPKKCCRRIVAHVAAENMTVFFSSHQIADVDQIADHIAIIDAGRTVVAGALDGPARATTGASSSYSTATRPRSHFARLASCARGDKGRVMTVLSSAGGDAARRRGAGASNPVSVDVLPVTLEGNLSRIRCGGGLTCSGRRPGSKHAGVFSAAWC